MGEWEMGCGNVNAPSTLATSSFSEVMMWERGQMITTPTISAISGGDQAFNGSCRRKLYHALSNTSRGWRAS
jgi:hypothetical protein